MEFLTSYNPNKISQILDDLAIGLSIIDEKCDIETKLYKLIKLGEQYFVENEPLNPFHIFEEIEQDFLPDYKRGGCNSERTRRIEFWFDRFVVGCGLHQQRLAQRVNFHYLSGLR